ncbi:MAG: carboxypeptidase-like regulatory domain-containing protein [Planctomycetota bacterium]
MQGATDGNGELEQEIAPGVYADIEVWHDQHGTKHFAGLTIAPEQRLDLEFVLAIGAELRGRVLDPDGHPVAGAVARTWQAYRSDSIEGLMARGSAASDALGAFFIRGLEGRSVWVTAQASGFAATACEVTLDEQRPASVELVLERAFVLEERWSTATARRW